ncbi:MAG: hypothetical protein L0Z62_07815 [Gemmataceae bacterium]|nr:hypothetical protein [Gemmataceae bacterium]
MGKQSSLGPIDPQYGGLPAHGIVEEFKRAYEEIKLDHAQSVRDPLNRASVTIDPLGNRTTTLFDAAGNVTSVTDASNNTTTFAYDALNRLSSQTDPLGETATFAYDGVGHLTSTTDRNGRRRDYAYDDAGRMTTETWVNVGGGTADILTYSYDAVSNLLSAANGNGTYAMTYDAVNRVTVAQGPFGVTQTFTYDAAGNRTVVQDSLGGLATSTYDALNRLSRREIGGASPLRLDQTYNGNGQLETQTRFKDLAGSQYVGSSTYTYDTAGRLTNLHHTNGSASTLGQYTYSYDAASRVTSEVINSATRTYTYDDSSQLTADGSSTFTYDGTGNRTNSGYSTGTGNRLANTPTWTYEYDDSGNLTKESLGPQDTTWTYGYDHRNQMIWAERRAMDGGTLQQRSEYQYDAFGNRLQKKVDTNGDGGFETTERYAYDGWKRPVDAVGRAAQLVGLENWDIWADLDGSSSLTTRYLRGDAIDQLLARLGAQSGWLLTDRQGSVRAVTDRDGVLKDTIAYDGFGNVVSETDSSWGGRYKWTGRELDSEIGLQYNRARYFDPDTGRWTTEDPKGFAAGNSNLYRYVHNGYTLATDPSGLDEAEGGSVAAASRLWTFADSGRLKPRDSPSFSAFESFVIVRPHQQSRG